MPTRLETYRFRDGKTPLGAETFNRIFADIDLRITTLEGLKVSWEDATRDLVAYGLANLQSTFRPIYQEAQTLIAAIRADEAEAEAHKDATLAALSQVQESATASIHAVEQAAVAPAWAIVPAADVLYTYVDGQVSRIVEVLAGLTRQTDYTYDPGTGRVATATVTWGGRSRTESFEYTDGRVTHIAVSETGAGSPPSVVSDTAILFSAAPAFTALGFSGGKAHKLTSLGAHAPFVDAVSLEAGGDNESVKVALTEGRHYVVETDLPGTGDEHYYLGQTGLLTTTEPTVGAGDVWLVLVGRRLGAREFLYSPQTPIQLS